MSSIYSLEPPTSGKVVLHTTLGPFEIELWAKEAPRAVRNFVQHCVDGYYDGTPFHRVVRGFVLQGGDPTGTGAGGESVYADGAPFQTECHSRLRFSHRGIVAMADDNRSQFFVTLDRCEELNGRHTIFGKVVGDTIFNVLEANALELDGERPVSPPRITAVEVPWNPFDDVVPRSSSSRTKSDEAKPPSVAGGGGVLKKTRDAKLLSFGDEEEAAAADAATERISLRMPAPAAASAVAKSQQRVVSADDLDRQMRERLQQKRKRAEELATMATTTKKKKKASDPAEHRNRSTETLKQPPPPLPPPEKVRVGKLLLRDVPLPPQDAGTAVSQQQQQPRRRRKLQGDEDGDEKGILARLERIKKLAASGTFTEQQL